MMKQEESIASVLQAFRTFDPTEWQGLPDIDLYMDQVTGYLRRQLALQEKDEESPIITANMINNYVKGGHIARANQKKYNKEQLASLYMLCSLKKCLPISDASALLSALQDGKSTAEVYNTFLEMQKESLSKTAERFSDSSEGDKDALLHLALSLVLSSVAESLLAERIIASLTENEMQANEEKKGKEEKKPKEEKKAKEKRAKKPQEPTAASKEDTSPLHEG